MSGGRIIRVSLLAALTLAAVFAHAGAGLAGDRDAELSKEKKKLEDVKKRLRETESSIERMSEKETGILGELERISETIERKRADVRRLDASITGIRAEMKETDRNIARLAEEKKSINRRLEKRLRAMYVGRSGGMARVIFSAPSDDPGRRYKYLTRLMDYDRGLIGEAEKNLSELRGERERLSGLDKRLREAREREVLARRGAEDSEMDRKKLLAGVRREKKSYLRMAGELEEAQNDLLELVKKLSEGGELPPGAGGGFAAKKGKLDMPVKGRIVSSFGKVTHPRFKTVTFNNGIVIEAPYGRKVRSVYPGRVVYVGWLRGYGQVMIMDNGGGYYTLFAYLSEMLKKRGDAVAEGETVGLVGDSGPQDVTGLYFEIRNNGVPRDPQEWLAAR